eukprot:scaffold2266_cov166-Ochromonas_danica.AAC.12
MINITVSHTDSTETFNAPATEKAKLIVHFTGEHATNALFRAEIKKEVSFFRGCPAFFEETSKTTSTLTAEGKTKQLVHVIDWLQEYGKDLSQRKPTFQGPSMVVRIKDLRWDSYEGKLKGFATSSDAPQLDGARPHQDNTIEAHNMAGTDESV